MKINATPNNLERYMSFMLGKNLVFIVMFQHIDTLPKYGKKKTLDVRRST